VLKALIKRTKPADGKCNISREELRTVYEYVVGNMPQSPNKFTSLLKHHRLHMEAVWVNNKTVRGVKTTWKDTMQFSMYLKDHLNSESNSSSASSAPTSTTTPKLVGKKAPKAKDTQ